MMIWFVFLAKPYQGLDFGFSQDPTAGVRAYIHDECLYIRNEAHKVELEIDDTEPFINKRILGWNDYVTRADNARPESISYLKRHGMIRIRACEKDKGSVEDGLVILPDLETLRSRKIKF